MRTSNGFAVMEIILVLVVIATLGFAGWTWWSMQQAEESINTAQVENEETQEEAQELQQEESQQPQKTQQKQKAQKKERKESRPGKKVLIKAAAKSYCIGADFLGCNPEIMRHTDSSAAVRVTNENPSGGTRSVVVSKSDKGAWRAILATNGDVCNVGSNAPELRELCNR